MTKYYINYSTSETEMFPNVTEYAHIKMLERGFLEVTEKQWDEYVKNHFND